MKNILLFSFLLLGVTGTSLAQSSLEVCADPLDAYKLSATVQRGGLHMTSIGAVKALVVFVQFAQENRASESTVWPLNQQPTYFNTFIDPQQGAPLFNGNLSHFYRRMSFDQFIIYGDPHFVVTQHPESYYIGQRGLTRAYGLANAEVLQTLDAQMNYADYDNWTFTPYDPSGHHPGPDGNIDLIVIFYRNSSYPGGGGGYGGSGIAMLGDEPDLLLDGKWIRFGFPWSQFDPPCSGITNGGGYAGQSLPSVRHEIGHFLFGAGHPSHGKGPCNAPGQPDNYGFHGIMSSHSNQTITAFERERMQWINFNDRPSGTSYGNIQDFVTTGVAYRIIIPGMDQAFVIENHQKVDPYFDDPISTWVGKGLYVYRVDGLDYDHPHYDVMSAEGDYNWSNPYWVSWGGWEYGILPVFRRLESNRFGFDTRDHLQHTMPNIRYGCLRVFYQEINGLPVFRERFQGDLKDFFNIGYNQVLSPWSNPAALRQDMTLTDIAVEITGKSIGINGEDIFTATFFNGGAINASPSKPQDVRGSYATLDPPNCLSLDRETKPPKQKKRRAIQRASFSSIRE